MMLFIIVSREKSVNTYTLLLFLLIPHFKPLLFEYVPALDILFNAWRVASFVAIMALYIRQKHRPDGITVSILLLQCWLFLATFIAGGDLIYAGKKIFPIVCMTLLLHLYDDRREMILRVLRIVLEALIFFNLVSIMLFPGGIPVMGENKYLLQGYNVLTMFYVLAMLVAFLSTKRHHAGIRNIGLALMIMLSVIFNFSGGTFAVFDVAILLLVVFGDRKELRSFWLFWLAPPLFLFSVLGMHMQDIMRRPLEVIMHKGTSIAGRSLLWQRCWTAIMQSPILGHGFVDTDLFRSTVGRSKWAVHPHNFNLMLLYTGGTVAVLLFLSVLYFTYREYRKVSCDRTRVVIILAFISWIIAGLVEPCYEMIWFMLPVLVRYAVRGEHIAQEYDGGGK